MCRPPRLSNMLSLFQTTTSFLSVNRKMAAGLAKEPSAQQHPHHRCTTYTCSTSWPSDTHSRAMAPDLTHSHTNRGICLLTCQYTVLQHRYNRAEHQTNTSRSCHSALIYHQSSPPPQGALRTPAAAADQAPASSLPTQQSRCLYETIDMPQPQPQSHRTTISAWQPVAAATCNTCCGGDGGQAEANKSSKQQQKQRLCCNNKATVALIAHATLSSLCTHTQPAGSTHTHRAYMQAAPLPAAVTRSAKGCSTRQQQ
jgi:hypothetical protein